MGWSHVIFSYCSEICQFNGSSFILWCINVLAWLCPGYPLKPHTPWWCNNLLVAACQSHFTHALIEYGFTSAFQISTGKVCGTSPSGPFPTKSYDAEYMILEECLYLDELAQKQQPLIYRAINVSGRDIYPQPTCWAVRLGEKRAVQLGLESNWCCYDCIHS